MPPEEQFGDGDATSTHGALRADISGEHGQAVAEVKGLSLMGTTLRVVPEQDAGFAVGDRVNLVFQFDRKRSVHVEATVQSRAVGEGFRELGFAFLNPAGLRAKLPAGLMRSFNERSAFRIEPLEPVVVELEFSSPDFQTSGRMRDLSFGGFSVAVDDDAGSRLLPGVEVLAEFTLAHKNRVVIFGASVRYRRRLEPGVWLAGLRFDRDRSSNFPSQLHSVTTYVMWCERERLQARLKR